MLSRLALGDYVVEQSDQRDVRPTLLGLPRCSRGRDGWHGARIEWVRLCRGGAGTTVLTGARRRSSLPRSCCRAASALPSPSTSFAAVRRAAFSSCTCGSDDPLGQSASASSSTFSARCISSTRGRLSLHLLAATRLNATPLAMAHAAAAEGGFADEALRHLLLICSGITSTAPTAPPTPPTCSCLRAVSSSSFPRRKR